MLNKNKQTFHINQIHQRQVSLQFLNIQMILSQIDI